MAAYEEQEYNNPFSFRIWMKLFPFFKPYKKFFAITLGLNILLAGVDILVPLFQSYAIDSLCRILWMEFLSLQGCILD